MTSLQPPDYSSKYTEAQLSLLKGFGFELVKAQIDAKHVTMTSRAQNARIDAWRESIANASLAGPMLDVLPEEENLLDVDLIAYRRHDSRAPVFTPTSHTVKLGQEKRKGLHDSDGDQASVRAATATVLRKQETKQPLQIPRPQLVLAKGPNVGLAARMNNPVQQLRVAQKQPALVDRPSAVHFSPGHRTGASGIHPWIGNIMSEGREYAPAKNDQASYGSGNRIVNDALAAQIEDLCRLPDELFPSEEPKQTIEGQQHASNPEANDAHAETHLDSYAAREARAAELS